MGLRKHQGSRLRRTDRDGSNPGTKRQESCLLTPSLPASVRWNLWQFPEGKVSDICVSIARTDFSRSRFSQDFPSYMNSTYTQRECFANSECRMARGNQETPSVELCPSQEQNGCKGMEGGHVFM